MKKEFKYMIKHQQGFLAATAYPNTFGFTLVEVLVALLILSVGLLGLAALQTFGMKYNQQSYQRTQAVFQAYDMIDRIRANPTAKTAGSYDAVTLGNKPAVGVNCAAASCTPAQLATYDINKWNTANERLLTNGRGAISTSGSRRTITISWIEEGIPATLTMDVDL